MCGLIQKKNKNLIAGFENAEDAGVYKLTDDIAIVQTIDFFTPIVDDPYLFGQIAAANALSDVYAMGGKPIVAMNIVGFPVSKLDISVLKKILEGGLAKLKEAEVTLVGGHSVEDSELKYGLSVTGTIHPGKVIRNTGAKTGDGIVLTKPLGTGIISTAIKANLASNESINEIIKSMTTLNKIASEIAQETGVNACTDITGFGLIGHICEMIAGEKKVGVKLDINKIPIFNGVEEFAKMGMVPGGAYRNKEFRIKFVEMSDKIPDWKKDVLFDPQTSGGLLICVSKNKVDNMVKKMRKAGIKDVTIIGEVINKPKGKIVINPDFC